MGREGGRTNLGALSLPPSLRTLRRLSAKRKEHDRDLPPQSTDREREREGGRYDAFKYPSWQSEERATDTAATRARPPPP